MPNSASIRVGLIGCGYVSKYHVAAAAALGLPITAACDTKRAAAEAVADQTGAQVFANAETLIASRAADAVIIATPHFLHVPLAIAALDQGLHVLCEKPLAITAEAAHEAVKAHARHRELTFAVNFNHRPWPLWRSIKTLIDGGTLGTIVRYQWTITDWYRSQWYFNQSAWRGTWAGEGGGLLVNQCPHQLDMIVHLFGAPTRVSATVRYGKHHDVDVEDEVHALFDHANGPTGSLVASTGEPCGTNRLEIVGDRGIVQVTSEDAYELTTFATPASVHTRTSQERSAPPAHSSRHVVTGGHPDEYRDVLDAFARACRGEPSDIATVEQAAAGVEIANAILLSGETGRSVTLPVDRPAFAALLSRLQAQESAGESR